MNNNQTIEIAGQSIKPGSSKSIQLQFSESYLGLPVSVPVYVMRALEEGPRVFITAAVHGDEINGLGIIRRLIFESSLKLKRGILVAIPVVNTYGFERHVRYLPDRRDLNRCFPGSPTGSLSSRLAHEIFSQVVSVCDYGIDLHTAAVRRTNYPTIRGDFKNPEVMKLAGAFETEVLINSSGPKGSLRRTATQSGVPTIIFEAGEVWKIEPAVIDVGATGCLNLLKSLDMVDGEMHKPSLQIRLAKTVWVRANQGGIVNFQAGLGEVVFKDQELAATCGVFGKEREMLCSPVNGIVIGMITLPVVKPGGPVYHIGVLNKRQFSQITKSRETTPEKSLFAQAQQDMSSSILINKKDSELNNKPMN